MHWDDLGDADATRLREYFRDQVFPVLTPLAVDPAHPFPYISGLSLNLAVSVRDPETGAPLRPGQGAQQRAAFIPVGPGRQAGRSCRWRTSSPRTSRAVPRAGRAGHHLFRVTRNADLEVEEDRDEDLLQALERELAQRRFGPAVRLEVTETIDPQILDVLVSRAGGQPGRRGLGARAARPGRADGALRPGPSRAQG